MQQSRVVMFLYFVEPQFSVRNQFCPGNEAPAESSGDKVMQWFYLIALTVTFAIVAKVLWKTEQVLSVAA